MVMKFTTSGPTDGYQKDVHIFEGGKRQEKEGASCEKVVRKNPKYEHEVTVLD